MADDGASNDDAVAADADAGGTDPFGASTSTESEADAELLRVSAELAEMRELAQRTQAEFENFKKRQVRQQTEHLEQAAKGLLEGLLPVLDSFELALGALDDAEEKVRKGVELVYAELLAVLAKAGLERMEAEGQPFDPNEHEAVMHEDGDGPEIVGDVMRTGYRLKGRVLRPAMVKVTR
jgi:molecular chaperone GrpE